MSRVNQRHTNALFGRYVRRGVAKWEPKRMKVTFDIECTPAEARAFFGLPDLTSVHDVYLDKLKATMSEGISPADLEKLTRAWMPGVVDGFEQWQKLFMAAIPKPPL